MRHLRALAALFDVPVDELRDSPAVDDTLPEGHIIEVIDTPIQVIDVQGITPRRRNDN
jgi:hypothetical protein